MASTPESKAKAQIMKRLHETADRLNLTVWIETHAGDAFSTPTLDITGAIRHTDASRHYGIPFAIEVKRFDGKGKLTGRQQQTIDAMRRAGIAVFVIDSETSLDNFIAWLETTWPLQLLLSTAAN